MPPVLHLVRHAQGFHQTQPNGHLIPDPAITPLGRDECLALRKNFPYHDKVELLMASPMRRALETALIAFDPVVQRGLRVLAIPLAQEATAEPSDTGSDIATLRGWFDDHVDLRFLTEGWNDKVGEMATDAASTRARAKKLRGWIKQREEKEVVLVSHGNFAHFLTGDVDEAGLQTTGWWINDEFRSFNFAENDDGEAWILETEESKLRRQRMELEREGKALEA